MDVHGIVQIGRPQIQVALAVPDEEIRRQRLWLLTQALMEDLHTWLAAEGRAALFIDAYDPDRVTPELRYWVESVLLSGVRRTPGLLVVVAGQQVPQRSLTWERACCRLHLKPLDNPDDWMEFVVAEDIPVEHRDVALLCHAHGGHPLRIILALSALRTWPGVS